MRFLGAKYAINAFSAGALRRTPALGELQLTAVPRLPRPGGLLLREGGRAGKGRREGRGRERKGREGKMEGKWEGKGKRSFTGTFFLTLSPVDVVFFNSGVP